MKCEVANCRNTTLTNNDQLSFFSFPKSARLAKKWELFCGNPKQTDPKNALICSEHFESNEIIEDTMEGTKRLRAGAVPSIESRRTTKSIKVKSKASEERPKQMSNMRVNLRNCTMPEKENEEMNVDESNIEESPQGVKDDNKVAELEETEMHGSLDMECYQAVIDELTNQNETLSMENLRLKVNMQLLQKKYKTEYKNQSKQLEKSYFQIKHFEKVLSKLVTKEQLKNVSKNIEKLWKAREFNEMNSQ